MTQVGPYRKSGTDHPHLNFLQVELNLLNAAAHKCTEVAKYVTGHNAELADEARDLATRLHNLGAEKHQDLTKPF